MLARINTSNDWLIPMKPFGGNHNDNLCGWCFTSLLWIHISKDESIEATVGLPNMDPQ